MLKLTNIDRELFKSFVAEAFDTEYRAIAVAPCEYRAAMLEILIVKAGRWDPGQHPRSDDGRFVSRDAIADAKGHPEKEEALRDKVTDPEERAKLDNALAGTTDLGRTKRGQQRHEAGQRREKRKADHKRAGEIADRIADGTATHEEMHELGDHLEGLTLDKLRALQSRIPTEGRTRRKAEVVRALRDELERSAHAKRVGDAAAKVETRPDADHARMALAGMLPNRYDVTTATGEVVPAGKGYQRYEGQGPAVGYTAEQAAKVAAGVTPDHADRRIADHEKASASPDLDDVQREYHGEMAAQLRGHKDAVFGGGEADASVPPVSTGVAAEGAGRTTPAKPPHELTRAEHAAALESGKINHYATSRVEDWGRLARGSGKRAGGMVRGAMSSPPTGKKTYTDILGSLPPEEKKDTVGYEKRQQAAYARARSAGFDHAHAQLAAFEANGDIEDAHKFAVEEALAAGKPVPPEVLADYPDLAPKGAPAASPPAGKPLAAPPPDPALDFSTEAMSPGTGETRDEGRQRRQGAANVRPVTSPQSPALPAVPHTPAVPASPSPLPAETPPGGPLESSPVKFDGMTVEDMAAVAARNGHDYDDALAKIKNRPGAWVGAVKDWKAAEDAERKVAAKDKRDANWKPNDKQSAVLDTVGGKRRFPAFNDVPMMSQHKVATRSLIARGVLERVETPDGVEYEVVRPPSLKPSDPATAHAATLPEGSPARAAIEAAVANGGGDKRRTLKELGHRHAEMADKMSPEEEAGYVKMMEAHGVKPLHAPGETKPFDPETMASDAGISTGTPVRVTRRGWTGLYGDAGTGHELVGNNWQRAQVEPAKSGNSPKNPSTTVDTGKVIGDTTPVPATPAGGGGKPMTGTTYYHGNANKLDRFQNTTGRGVSFTTDRTHAEGFGRHLHEARLDVKKPVDILHLGSGGDPDSDEAVSSADIQDALAAHGINIDMQPAKGFTTDILRGYMPEVIRQAQAQGYDHLKVKDFKDRDIDETVVFDPEKSARVVRSEDTAAPKPAPKPKKPAAAPKAEPYDPASPIRPPKPSDLHNDYAPAAAAMAAYLTGKGLSPHRVTGGDMELWDYMKSFDPYLTGVEVRRILDAVKRNNPKPA